MQSNPGTKVLEQGSIYFFYRPKVEEKNPESEADVQRFFVVLSPDQRKLYRLLTIGQKELPDPEDTRHKRYWGYVSSVSENAEGIRAELAPLVYSTKTRGERHIEAARPAGEGIYRIVNHYGHTDLVYILEFPENPGAVQNEFNIKEHASYIITVKNPQASSPPYVGLPKSQAADYPPDLQKEFRGRRFSELQPPELLDYEGAQFILIATSDNVWDDMKMLSKAHESSSTADIFEDLKIDRKKRPVKPLFEGEWE